MEDGKQLPRSHHKAVKIFEGHKNNIMSIATFRDGNRMATASPDKTIRIWRLEDGTEITKWVVKQEVTALVLWKNGECVVSAEGEIPDDYDYDDLDDVPLHWQLWVREVESGRVVAGPLEGHTNVVIALDISPDGGILASGSFDRTVILWDTSTWKKKGHPLFCGSPIAGIRFSPIGQLGVATKEDIQIWDLDQKKSLITQFKGHNEFNGINAINASLAWTPDGAHLLSAGDGLDPVIRSWDTSTWKQAGDPWIGHDKHINQIILNPAGTLLASASDDCTVRLWQFPTRAELAQFKHSDLVMRVAFSVDGRSIFSGGLDKKISQWEIPEDVLAAAEIDALASAKNEATRSKHNMKRLLNSEIPGQHRNKPVKYQHLNASRGWDIHSASPLTHAESPSSSRLLKTFFDGIRPSSDNKGKQKERRSKPNAPQVVDVPLGEATYGDVVGVDDGIRPYVLLFCLSWFQKKKKKPDPPRPVYDDELDDDESDHSVRDVPMPTTRTQNDTDKKTKLTPISFFQSQPEAGPSRLSPPVELDVVDVPIPTTRIVQHEEMELTMMASRS